MAATTAPATVNAQVRPFELLEMLATHAPRVKVLSLDCFDTLLWRRTATPSDVFFDLARRPPFAALGLSARLRAQGEAVARSLRKVRGALPEVRLAEIYQGAFPELPADRLAELAEAELAAEMEACYPFPPTCELIRAARARGLRVVLVSDTYLDEVQLRRLLAHTLPADVLAAVERVFVSSEHRMGKCDGLFGKVIEALRVPPDAILHVGDNPHADFLAPRDRGLQAIQLVQNDAATTDVLRLQGTALALLDPAVRHTTAVPSPFHGVLAQRPGAHDPGERLGYTAAGPILYAFGRLVLDELDALARAGKHAKPLFLMRDAYLPHQVVNAIAGRAIGHPIGISRFASVAASFRTPDDVDRYLARFAGSKRFDDLARQLLLPEGLARELVSAAGKKHRPVEEFLRRVHRPDVMATIIERSKAYLGRMYRYLHRTAGVERGDTVVFIDLGYEGTAQRLLEPLFRDELGIEVQGLYLLVVGTPGWERSRKGLIDPSNADERAILSIVDQIALVEDVCTTDGESVVDYDEQERPVYAPTTIARDQLDRVKPVQAACVAFAKDAERFFAEAGGRPDAAALRRAALGQLGRLSYFPTREEMAYLEGFHLDMNLATKDTFRLFDREEGIRGLRRRGLFFMEMNLKARRMNYPIELRYAGLELAVTFFAQQRYGLGFAHSDFTLRRESVPFILTRDGRSSLTTCDAHATHDGYFALHIPVGEGELSAAVLFGRRYTWVQLESVQLVPAHALYKDHESQVTEDVLARVKLDGMVERAPQLFECASDAAFLFLPEKMTATRAGRWVCRVVFRPIASREAVVAKEAAAAG